MAILLCSIFLLTASLGMLIFGENILGHENEYIEQATGSAQTDMLYIHPKDHR